MNRRHLSVRDVSNHLGVDLEEVRRAMRAGAFPGRLLVDGEIRVPEAAVEAWKVAVEESDPDAGGEGESSEGRAERDGGRAECGLEAALRAHLGVMESLVREIRALRRELAPVETWSGGDGTEEVDGAGFGREAGVVMQELSELEELFSRGGDPAWRRSG